jgi:hypothetical protein
MPAPQGSATIIVRVQSPLVQQTEPTVTERSDTQVRIWRGAAMAGRGGVMEVLTSYLDSDADCPQFHAVLLSPSTPEP